MTIDTRNGNEAVTKIPAQTLEKGRKPVAMTPAQNTQSKPSTTKPSEK